MSLQFQSLFDSVCRCFGHDGQPPPGVAGAASQHDGSSHASVKRRTNRLELKDKQWDELFEKKKNSGGKSSSGNASRRSSNADVATDLGTAQAVAQAKISANHQPKHGSKRKRSARSREEIFRMKNAVNSATSSNNNQAPTPFSRLLNPSLALCFATPIRGTEEEEADVLSENSDTNTLNTCEDTITSTVCFENKYSHLVETRPPMPLLHQFRVGQDKDEIRHIIATDSHSSVKMIKLMQQQQQQVSTEPEPMQLEDSSSDSDGERQPDGPARRNDNLEEMPDVKAVSSSTDSSRQSHSGAQDAAS